MLYRLKYSKKPLIIFLLVIALISVILIKTSQAKYSVGHIYEDIVTGNVVNNTGDLIIENIYIDDEPVDEIPEGNYEVDDRSECTVHGDKQDIEFSYENGKLGIFGVVKRNTKCTIYLNTKKDPLAPIIAQAKTDKPDFSKTSCLNGTNNSSHSGSNCGEETNGLYKETTSLGDTYYYRGSVNNNWVKYGTTAEGQPIWWRIIRINEDRTVRLIYAGEGEQAPASTDQVGEQGGYWMSNSWGIGNTSYTFNNSYASNAYVGYMYGTPGSDSFAKEHGYDLIDSGEVNKLQSSDIKKTIDEWYKNNLADEGAVLSGKTGFCGDRTPAVYKDSGYTNDGYGTEKTYYKAYDRIARDKIPSLECPDSKHDLYTTKTEKGDGNGALDYPIGLITIDETVYAGTNWSAGSNYGFWLRTGQYYWALSPYRFDSRALVFLVQSGGNLGSFYVVGARGVRSTVNLKAEALTTEGRDGTINNPYIVE